MKIMQRVLMALKVLGGAACVDDSRTLAELGVEIAERNGEIARLRREYALLKEQSREQVERAADEAVEALVRQFAAPMATLSAMQARHLKEGGQNPSDIFQVAASFGNTLAERGVQQIGQVGEEQPYDPGVHQMLDGSRPHPGQPVLVRFCGFRFKGRLVAKAQTGTPGS